MAPDSAAAPLCALRRRAGRTWTDWRWQMRASARTPAALAAWLGETPAAGLDAVAARYPMCTTPYYASLIRPGDPRDPVRRMLMPRREELADAAAGRGGDPFDEAGHTPVPGLIRRYRDRAVLLATDRCAVYCRHCTRKHSVGAGEGPPVVRAAPGGLARITAWLTRHPEVREILVSGGDPLTLPDARIGAILRALRAVPSVEIIRIGSRVPVTLPMRITPRLARLLGRAHPLWLNTHFNHPRELTAEAATACARLADEGIPLGNQTVLLRGVNDRVATLEALFRGLLRMRVRPYYLLHCDPVEGVGHFRVPLDKALALADELRARMSGLGVPVFVVDAPGGAGKVPLTLTRVESIRAGTATLRAPRGRIVRYPV